MRRKVVLSWQASSFFGWGVYGLNLALAWASDPDVEAISAHPVTPQQMAIDPIRAARLRRFEQQSNQLAAQLGAMADPAITAQTTVLAASGGDFSLPRIAGGKLLTGTPTIGVTFFETANLAPEAVAAAARLPVIVAGSNWNAEVLRAHGLTNVRTVLQGVDPLLFHPAPAARPADDRFLVFSGGKLELRKGQDIAMAAFRRFAERRPDAVLVAAWHSPWPALARGVDQSRLAAPVVFHADGSLDAAGWAKANGLAPGQFIDAGQVPNVLVPHLLRQCDVALFPNRCEGGTNLAAMEAMACGVPTVLSANSGHLDLIGEDNCYVLASQGEIRGSPLTEGFGDVRGWGESDVDEAVELLERAYAEREDARRRGARGAETLAGLTWARTAAEMKAIVQEFSV